MKKLIMLMCLFAFLGCSTKISYMSPLSQEPEMIAADESAIVFIRTGIIGTLLLDAPVVEMNDGAFEFVGFVGQKACVLHKTAPGKHMYTVESGHLMEADLLPGKVYYVYVSPRPSLMAKFKLNPVEKPETDADLKEDLAKCKWYTPNESSTQWLLKNYDYMKSRIDYYNRSYLTPEMGISYILN